MVGALIFMGLLAFVALGTKGSSPAANQELVKAIRSVRGAHRSVKRTVLGPQGLGPMLDELRGALASDTRSVAEVLDRPDLSHMAQAPREIPAVRLQVCETQPEIDPTECPEVDELGEIRVAA